MLLFSITALAQKGIIKGKVIDINHRPLEGVTVVIKNSNKGTYADEKGVFIFKNINYGKVVLQISEIGYTTVSKTIILSRPLVETSVQLLENVEDLEEVVIVHNHQKTANKEQSLQIEQVKSDFIQQNLSGSLLKSLEKLPGVSTISIGSGQAKPVIRGLSFNRVLVSDKGVKHEAQQWGADHGLEIDQFAVKNIEIIKGPSSLAYGSDAVGGVFHIKEASFPEKHSFYGEVSSSYMSNNQSFSGSVSVTKRFEKLFLKARATKVKYADYKVPTSFVNIYDYQVALHENKVRNTAGEEENFHLTVGYISKNFNTTFYGSSYYTKAGLFANAHGLEPIKVDNKLYDKSSFDIINPLQKVHHYKLINSTKIFLNEHTLLLLGSLQKNKREERSNYVPHGFMPDIYPQKIAEQTPQNLERKFDKIYMDFKIADKIAVEKHRLNIGAEINYTENKIGGWGFIVPDFNRLGVGVFAIDKYALSDNLFINGGVRYDWGRINIKEYSDWFTSKDEFNQPIYLQRVREMNKNFGNFSFSLGVNYNRDKWRLKANIGKSFRMPIAKELATNGINYHYFRYEKGNRNLSPENSYQADISWEWEDSHWNIALSPFVNYFSNYIYLNPTPHFDYYYGAGNQIFEYGQSRVFRYGGELRVYMDLYKKLCTEIVAEYVKSKHLSGTKKGFGLPFSPPFSMMITPKYIFHSSEIFLEPYMSLNYKIVATQNDIVPPEKVTKGYQLLNVNLGTKIKLKNYDLALSIQVQNVANTFYFNHTNFYRLIDLPEQGRNIIASLKMDF